VLEHIGPSAGERGTVRAFRLPKAVWAEAAVSEVPGLEDEAILAEEALIEDRAYGQQ
jgi:hypothetical protein